MIVLVVALPMLLLQRSLGGRVRLLVVGAVLIAVTAAALPGYLRERYLTFMEARGPDEVGQPMTEAEQDILASAVGSAQGRKKLFLDSLRFTLQHPLLGVGIGMFMVAENEEAVDLGNRGMWRGTHNTYTQFSSEAGIPAFVFLVALLVVSFRILQRMEKAARLSHHPNRQQTAAAAAVLRPFLFAIAVGMFFIHMAYTPFIPTLIGVVFGLAVCTLEEIKAAEGPVPALRAAPTGEDRLRAPAGNLQVRGRS